jgi:hypothetical protein
VWLGATGCENGGADEWDPAAFEATVQELDTPAKAVAYMQTHFTFAARPGCTALPPSAMYAARTGDCKDYATFFAYVLRHHAFECSVVTYLHEDANGFVAGHVTTLFRDRNGVQWYQTDAEILGPVGSIEDMLENERRIVGWHRVTCVRVAEPGTTELCCE